VQIFSGKRTANVVPGRSWLRQIISIISKVLTAYNSKRTLNNIDQAYKYSKQ